MTERQKMFLEIAKAYDSQKVRREPGCGSIGWYGICDTMKDMYPGMGFNWFKDKFFDLVEASEDFWEGWLWRPDKAHLTVRATFCCLLAAMSDEDYEELTK